MNLIHTFSRALVRFPFGNGLALRIFRKMLRAISDHTTATTSFGALMRCDLRDFIQSSIFHFGTWEPSLTEQIKKNYKSGSIFIDVGANVGYYSILVAHAFKGKVIAIEASHEIAEKLHANIELNGLQHSVKVLEMAIGPFGEATIYNGPSENIGRTTTRVEAGFHASGTVLMQPLSTVLSDAEKSNTSLIKIDIEGAEKPVIADILDHIEEFPNDVSVIVEVANPQDDEWKVMFDRFVKAGFSAWIIENDYSWSSLAKPPSEPRLMERAHASQADVLLKRQT